MRKALQFYANENNYLDGAPMFKHPDTGLYEGDDEGAMARQALRLVDVSLGVAIRKEEGNDVAA